MLWCKTFTAPLTPPFPARTHTLQHDLVAELQGALDYLWEASRYEVMGEVAKLLLPFYEEEREYEVMAMGDSP